MTQLDIMALPPALVRCLNKIARDTFITAADFASSLNLTPRQAHYLARLLVNKGYLLAEGGEDRRTATYKINYLQRTRRRTPSAILDTLTFGDD